MHLPSTAGIGKGGNFIVDFGVKKLVRPKGDVQNEVRFIRKIIKKTMEKKSEDRVTINIANTQYDVVKIISQELGWTLNSSENSEDWDICWQDFAVTPEKFNKMQLYQKINHFPGMCSLARKNNLANNLNQMQKLCPEEYDFFPDTWSLPKDLFDLKNSAKFNILIAKPESSCQGKGIILVKHIEELPEKCVVQKYLSNPFLIDNLKFDLRIYVLLTGCDPLRLFIHQEGLVRFATAEYKDPKKNLLNHYMHLTNYAVNKNNPLYQADANESFLGHKRSLTWLLIYLQSQGHDILKLWKEICGVVVKTILSGLPCITHLYKSCHSDDPTNSMCFEVLGFDVILDQALKPWLLEVNHSPSFTTDSDLDMTVKKKVISDAITLLNLTTKNRSTINSLKTRLRDRVSIKSKEYKKWKETQRNKWVFNRDLFEQQQATGFVKIFPSYRQDYLKLLEISNQVWSKITIPKQPLEVEEPIKGTVRKKYILPKLKKKLEILSKKKPNSPVEIHKPFQSTFKAIPAPRRVASKIELKPKKSLNSSGNFILMKTISYAGDHAPEENKSFMKWKLVRQNLLQV